MKSKVNKIQWKKRQKQPTNSHLICVFWRGHLRCFGCGKTTKQQTTKSRYDFPLKQCNISFLESDKTVLEIYLAYLTKNYYEPEH